MAAFSLVAFQPSVPPPIVIASPNSIPTGENHRVCGEHASMHVSVSYSLIDQSTRRQNLGVDRFETRAARRADVIGVSRVSGELRSHSSDSANPSVGWLLSLRDDFLRATI
ncbi:hypothetical protein ACJQWK_03827 [Exserohilum turcicum]